MTKDTVTKRAMNQTTGTDPQITALVPTYNRAHLVKRAINSILKQSFAPFEIIVVDDGSRDDTREIVAEFGDKVHYIYQDNAGSAAARHNGMQVAQTEWVALLDSDDVWNPDHLERMADAIKATNGRANYYFADTQRPKEHDRQMQWHLAGFAIQGPFEFREQGSDWVLTIPQPMMLQATVINRPAYLASGGFWKPLRFRDDTHLFIKLGLKGPICAVAGGGTVMTDDDEPDNRLSVNYDHAKRGTTMQVLMFEDLLEYFDGQLTPAERDILTYRLGNAYLGLARVAWRERDISGLSRYLVQSGRRQPRVLVDMIGRKLPG